MYMYTNTIPKQCVSSKYNILLKKKIVRYQHLGFRFLLNLEMHFLNESKPLVKTSSVITK